jgi:hypothetical protein
VNGGLTAATDLPVGQISLIDLARLAAFMVTKNASQYVRRQANLASRIKLIVPPGLACMKVFLSENRKLCLVGAVLCSQEARTRRHER